MEALRIMIKLGEVMKQWLPILFVSSLFISAHSEQELTGLYTSAKPSLLNQVTNKAMRARYHVMGSELRLRGDSSFDYTTCGNIITGTWSSDDKNLYLLYKTNKYRIDSLNHVWPKIVPGTKPHTFTIANGNRLYYTMTDKDGSKTIELLVKQ